MQMAMTTEWTETLSHLLRGSQALCGGSQLFASTQLTSRYMYNLTEAANEHHKNLNCNANIVFISMLRKNANLPIVSRRIPRYSQSDSRIQLY